MHNSTIGWYYSLDIPQLIEMLSTILTEKKKSKYKGYIQIPHDHNFLLCLQKMVLSLSLNILYPFHGEPQQIYGFIFQFNHVNYW